MMRVLVPFLLLFALSTPTFAQKGGPLAPDEAFKALKVADGFQVELFAAEPMFDQPDDDRRRSQGPRLGRARRSTTGGKAFGRPIIRKEGDRIVILDGHQGRRQGGRGDDVLPGAGDPRPARHRASRRTRTARGRRSSSASRRTSSSSRTRTATARPTARRRSSSPASAASTTTTASTASSSARTASSTSPSATPASTGLQVERRQGPEVDDRTTPTARPAPSGAATSTARTSN